MLNKKLLNTSITLFSKYLSITETDEQASVFKKDYSEVLIPTFINDCLLTSKQSYKITSGLNHSLGEVDLVLSLNSSITQAYRIINGQKIFVKYIDEAAYKTLSLEEQYNKYFTLYSGLSFVNGVYPHSKELDISAIKIQNLEALGFDKYSINSITKSSKKIIKLQAKIG